jgi:hypothetical protein
MPEGCVDDLSGPVGIDDATLAVRLERCLDAGPFFG